MPKLGGEIPDWVNSIKYPDESDVEEFAYQIFLRQWIVNINKWVLEKKHANSAEARYMTETVLTDSANLRGSFKVLKNLVAENPSEGQSPIWWSRIIHSPTANEEKQPHIYTLPKEKPLNHEVAICPNLSFSDKEIIKAFKVALREIRQREAPFVTSNWANPGDKSNAIINFVYCDPMSYLRKWKTYKILHAVDLSILRAVSGNKILQSQIVQRLGVGDESRYRKTTKVYMSEMMGQGVVDALLYAIKHGNI